MYMGYNADGLIDWVGPEDLSETYSGTCIQAAPNAQAGMLWDGTVLSPRVFTKEEVDNLRKAAYQQRSDPLYMQWQYDQTPEAEQRWRAEVAAIKQEYPWPA